jgi:hypothetical protein
VTPTVDYDRPALDSPQQLVAIILAARQSRNRGLEQAARRELEEQHGIDVRFRRRQTGGDRG